MRAPSLQLDGNSRYIAICYFQNFFLLHEEVIWQDLKWFLTVSDGVENEIGEL
jgi:hypothetical protein